MMTVLMRKIYNLFFSKKKEEQDKNENMCSINFSLTEEFQINTLCIVPESTNPEQINKDSDAFVKFLIEICNDKMINSILSIIKKNAKNEYDLLFYQNVFDYIEMYRKIKKDFITKSLKDSGPVIRPSIALSPRRQY